MTRKQWTAIAGTAAIILAVIIVAIAVDSSSSKSIDLPAIEQQIQSGLSEQTNEDVSSVDCIRKSDREASCVATFSDQSTAPVTVDVDPDTDTAIWHVR